MCKLIQLGRALELAKAADITADSGARAARHIRSGTYASSACSGARLVRRARCTVRRHPPEAHAGKPAEPRARLEIRRHPPHPPIHPSIHRPLPLRRAGDIDAHVVPSADRPDLAAPAHGDAGRAVCGHADRAPRPHVLRRVRGVAVIPVRAGPVRWHARGVGAVRLLPARDQARHPRVQPRARDRGAMRRRRRLRSGQLRE